MFNRTRYNGLNVCVPSKFVCGNPNPQVGGRASGRGSGHEDGALMKERITLVKENLPKGPLAFFTT